MSFNKKRKARENKKSAGAGILGLLTGILATYFLYGTKKGKEKRERVKNIAKDIKKDVGKRINKAEDITEKTYNDIVDAVAEKYKNIKNIDKKELEEIVEEIKGHWNSIKKQILEGEKPSKRGRSKKK